MNTRSIGRVLVGVALLVVSLVVPATTRADDRPNSLHAGAWAIQFGIGNDFRLTSYEGGFFSVKRHFSEKSALRAVIDGGFTTDNREQGYTNGTTRFDTNTDMWNVGVTVIYQRYLNPGDDVAIQFGVGPSVSYYKRDLEYTNIKVGTDTTAVESSWRTTSYVGGVFVLGAEFFVIRTISLHAEYVGSLRYSSLEDVYEFKDYNDTRKRRVENSDGWSADADNVRFGLSVYF